MQDCPLKPLYERLIVKRDTAKTMTDNGLELPENARAVPNTGVVLAVGLSPADWPTLMEPFEIGQRVMFSQFGANEVKVGGVPYLIVSARDVSSIVETAAEVTGE